MNDEIKAPAQPETVTEPAPKKRRGRPPKNHQAGETAANPVGATEAPKRKAKRQGGSLAPQIVGLHKLVAMITGVSELEISEPEAEILAEGVRGVMEEYDLEISGKTGATLTLIAAAAAVYIPRAAMVIERKREKAPEEKKPEPPAELPNISGGQKVPLMELASASASA